MWNQLWLINHEVVYIKIGPSADHSSMNVVYKYKFKYTYTEIYVTKAIFYTI